MKFTFRTVLLTAVFLGTGTVLAQAKEEFRPFKLEGDWKFTNTNTGSSFGGDVQVDVERVDEKGVMWGKASYDGRQTNDKCGTRALFKDEPAEAEIVKVTNGYRVTYEAKCSVGRSPRTVSLTLACSADGICIRNDELPHGKGVLRLQEKR